MKILHVSHSDKFGGAARAAFRLHKALLACGEESRMLVQLKLGDEESVAGPAGGLSKAAMLVRQRLGKMVVRLQSTTNPAPHSCGVIPKGLGRRVKESAANIVHLHWIGHETLSIAEIGSITKPLIWTLHDMWAFCGTEHLAPEGAGARWKTGYSAENRDSNARGIDLDRLIWRQKRRCWRRPISIVAPSNWLADRAKESLLMRDWPIRVIPNVLDTTLYQPFDRSFARSVFGIPLECKVVLFGAFSGSKEHNKGFDLLKRALLHLQDSAKEEPLFCAIFGQSEPSIPTETINFPMRWMGRLQDDWSLSLLYSAADVMVVPSRQEAFGQTASEAHACGCPVVAFDTSGLRDVVAHRETGYLARSFDTEDLALGIEWVLGDSLRANRLSTAARERAVRLWSPDVVVPQYLNAYNHLGGERIAS